MNLDELYESEAYRTFKAATDAWLAQLRKHIAEVTRATYPTASALLVEITYNDDSTGVALSGVLDADGKSLHDTPFVTPTFDRLADALWEPLNNLNDLNPMVFAGDEGVLTLHDDSLCTTCTEED